MQGIAQEMGVDVSELKVILIGYEHQDQVDLKPFQTLQSQYDKVEWDCEMLDPHHNPEPYIEIRLKQDVPLLQPYSTSPQSIAYDMKGSECYAAGDRPVDLSQVGSYGSCLSTLRSRLVCAMEGEFMGRGAVKMGAVKSFQGGSHINKKVPESFAQSPLPLETFHTQGYGTRLSKASYPV